MYERNAIVLERYFYELFKYKEKSNLKENYKNYCTLIEKFEKYKNATEAERIATNEFEKVTDEIRKIQKNGEKLYNRSAKLEYSRYIVFENIEEKTEEIKRCLEKIEKDVEKNMLALQSLDKDFMVQLEDYKIKKDNLFTCQEKNKKAKENYEKILEKTKMIYENISYEDINIAKDFIQDDNKDKKKELNNILTENGINERNPFDPDIISNSVQVSFDIYKKEIEIYLNGYEKTSKLLEEIQEDDIKLDKHKKFINDSNCKVHFLNAEKEYIVGFLDNERLAAIYDKKMHRKLMLEACRNFELDMLHINNMYDILLKEALSRSSKRLYKEKYNKYYLTDIENESKDINEENNKIKANAIAVVNLNYWRIEGISNLQDVFEKDVKEIYGRDLNEIFPKEEIVVEELKLEKIEVKEDVLENQEIVEDSKNSLEAKVENILSSDNDNEFIKNPNYKILKSSKETLQKVINGKSDKKEEKIEAKEDLDSKLKETVEVEEEDFNESADSNGLFEKIAMLDELDDENIIEQPGKLEDKNNEANFIENSIIETDNKDESSEETDEQDEESIFDFYFKQPDLNERKRRLRDEKKLNGNTNKKNIFKKIIGFNSKKQKEA